MTKSDEKIVLQIPGYRHLQDARPIIRLEGYGNYTRIYMALDQKPLLVSQTLKRFESQLPTFIRISKSTIINPDYVESVIKEDVKIVYLKLTTGLSLLISRRRIASTLTRLESFWSL